MKEVERERGAVVVVIATIAKNILFPFSVLCLAAGCGLLDSSSLHQNDYGYGTGAPSFKHQQHLIYVYIFLRTAAVGQ